jgi:DNA-binding transcriptional regulator YiaG
MKCEICGEALVTRRLPIYEADALIGLPFVFVLDAAVERWCEKCQHGHGVAIPDEEGLEAAVAMARIHVDVKLTGQDIRFLRRAIGYPAKAVAGHLQTTHETISRWENGHLPIGPQPDKLFRFLVARKLIKAHPWLKLSLDEEVLHEMVIPSTVGAPPPPVQMAFARALARVDDHQPPQETWYPKEAKAA